MSKETAVENTDLLHLEQIAPSTERPLVAQKEASHGSRPSDLIALAINQGADLDRLERLWAMQTQWEAREAEKAYNVAFAEFKAEAVRIIKNKSVSDGPLKSKKYAELFAVVNAATPALSRHGLSASWSITKDERDWIEVTCSLKHINGHSQSVSMGGPPDTGGAKNAIQARASTVSYLERYTLKAITGLSEQEDDNEGNGAEADEAALKAFRDAAMGGTAALRAHYEKTKPTDDFWTAHSKSLKEAAKQADERGAK
jgi:hypothetical protein